MLPRPPGDRCAVICYEIAPIVDFFLDQLGEFVLFFCYVDFAMLIFMNLETKFALVEERESSICTCFWRGLTTNSFNELFFVRLGFCRILLSPTRRFEIYTFRPSMTYNLDVII